MTYLLWRLPLASLLAWMGVAGLEMPVHAGGGPENMLLIVDPVDESALRIANAYITARNIPTDYELRYTVAFDVKGPDSQLLAPQEITLSKDYSFEENVLLAKEHEADILRGQMARDLATMAMHRLARLK